MSQIIYPAPAWETMIGLEPRLRTLAAAIEAGEAYGVAYDHLAQLDREAKARRRAAGPGIQQAGNEATL